MYQSNHNVRFLEQCLFSLSCKLLMRSVTRRWLQDEPKGVIYGKQLKQNSQSTLEDVYSPVWISSSFRSPPLLNVLLNIIWWLATKITSVICQSASSAGTSGSQGFCPLTWMLSHMNGTANDMGSFTCRLTQKVNSQSSMCHSWPVTTHHSS